MSKSGRGSRGECQVCGRMFDRNKAGVKHCSLCMRPEGIEYAWDASTGLKAVNSMPFRDQQAAWVRKWRKHLQRDVRDRTEHEQEQIKKWYPSADCKVCGATFDPLLSRARYCSRCYSASRAQSRKKQNAYIFFQTLAMTAAVLNTLEKADDTHA